MSAVFKRGNANVQANLTPLIDVTFLLIVFFVLVSQIVEAEHVEMDLPQPREAASHRPGDENRVVINLLPGPPASGSILGYRLGGREFMPGREGVEQLTERLAEMYRANPTLHINLRADRSTHYEWIDPVMQAISRAARLSGQPDAIARVNLAITRRDELQ
jgi:biopolymer transport protein ExbD